MHFIKYFAFSRLFFNPPLRRLFCVFSSPRHNLPTQTKLSLVVHGAGLRGEVAGETAVGAPDDDGSHDHVGEEVGDHPAGHDGPGEAIGAGDIGGLDGGPVDLDDLTLTNGGGGRDVLESAGGKGGTGAEGSGAADGEAHGHNLLFEVSNDGGNGRGIEG